MFSHYEKEILTGSFGVSPKAVDYCETCLREAGNEFKEIEKISGYNQLKVVSAMQSRRLSDGHFASTTGYGYNDLGRDALEGIYAQVFSGEDALVRPQLISGTHALSTALFGNLRHGDELVSVTGAPYDTLLGVIGVRPEKGSLMEHGVSYKQVDLKEGKPDFDGIRAVVTPKTRMVAVQRSKGYSWRPSLLLEEIGDIIAQVKSISKDIIVMVDNCYGEFVDYLEPGDLGADLTVGSLIKNPGGGLAPVGGYIAGKAELVENAAIRLSSPGVGKEAGPTLGVTEKLLHGLFLAPSVVEGAVKSASLAARIFGGLGFDVMPRPGEKRSDIVQAIGLQTPEALLEFCRGIQAAAPVDSFVTPEPWAMPGYDCPVVMAAGAFVQGSSIELSADGPMREPYIAYMQGGLTFSHGRLGSLMALNRLLHKGIISL